MRRRLPPRGMFASEQELCQVLLDFARARGYIAHSEVSGWDILLVNRETGEQIGVEAKLRPSVDVLCQALVKEDNSGPDVHAVLVPAATDAFNYVAGCCRVVVFEGARLNAIDPRVQQVVRNHFQWLIDSAPRWKHSERAWAPDVEVLVPAGTPAPKRTTKWKLAAVELCLRARAKGHVTSADLKELRLNRHWWFAPAFGPVLRVASRGTYVLHDPSSPKVPDVRWPEIATAIIEQQRRVIAFAANLSRESAVANDVTPRIRRRGKISSLP